MATSSLLRPTLRACQRSRWGRCATLGNIRRRVREPADAGSGDPPSDVLDLTQEKASERGVIDQNPRPARQLAGSSSSDWIGASKASTHPQHPLVPGEQQGPRVRNGLLQDRAFGANIHCAAENAPTVESVTLVPEQIEGGDQIHQLAPSEVPQPGSAGHTDSHMRVAAGSVTRRASWARDAGCTSHSGPGGSGRGSPRRAEFQECQSGRGGIDRQATQPRDQLRLPVRVGLPVAGEELRQAQLQVQVLAKAGGIAAEQVAKGEAPLELRM